MKTCCHSKLSVSNSDGERGFFPEVFKNRKSFFFEGVLQGAQVPGLRGSSEGPRQEGAGLFNRLEKDSLSDCRSFQVPERFPKFSKLVTRPVRR